MGEVRIVVYLTKGRESGQAAGRPNFGGLVLGCIDAEFCNRSLIQKLAARYRIHISLQIPDLKFSIRTCQRLQFSDICGLKTHVLPKNTSVR